MPVAADSASASNTAGVRSQPSDREVMERAHAPGSTVRRPRATESASPPPGRDPPTTTTRWTDLQATETTPSSADRRALRPDRHGTARDYARRLSGPAWFASDRFRRQSASAERTDTPGAAVRWDHRSVASDA